jgi:hypothetical protein
MLSNRLIQHSIIPFWTCFFAVAGLLPSLATACGTLAAELQQALKHSQQQQQPQQQLKQQPTTQQQLQPTPQQEQQQQPSKGLKGGFFGASSSQQQRKQASRQPQQQAPPDPTSVERGFDIADVLVLLWQALVVRPTQAEHITRVFTNAAVLSSILPAVKLMLVLLQAQEPHTLQARSSSSSTGTPDPFGLPLQQVQTALGTACDLVQTLSARPLLQFHLRSKPGVTQLLAAPELQQVLVVTGACLGGVLYHQQVGQMEVPTADAVRLLSNTAATSVYAVSSSSSSSSTGIDSRDSSSSSSKLEPHHAKVLELLRVPAADPLRQPDPASVITAGFLNGQTTGAFHHTLSATCHVTELCLDNSRRASNTTAGRQATSAAGSSSGSSSSSSITGSWQQFAPALSRMLVGVVQLGPDVAVRAAAVKLLWAIAAAKDCDKWQQPAGAAAISDMMGQLGPAVLHAVQQQQQQQEQEQQLQLQKMEQTQQLLQNWSMLMMHMASAGKSSRQHFHPDSKRGQKQTKFP